MGICYQCGSQSSQEVSHALELEVLANEGSQMLRLGPILGPLQKQMLLACVSSPEGGDLLGALVTMLARWTMSSRFT